MSLQSEFTIYPAIDLRAGRVVRLLRGDLHGLLITAAGMLAVGLVRPHVALIAMTALVVAVVVGSPGRGAMSSVARVALIAALLIGGSVASDEVEALSDIDGLNPTGLVAALDLVNARSSQGGSHFEAARIDGITEYPWGFVTVLFRPLKLQNNWDVNYRIM